MKSVIGLRENRKRPSNNRDNEKKTTQFTLKTGLQQNDNKMTTKWQQNDNKMTTEWQLNR